MSLTFVRSFCICWLRHHFTTSLVPSVTRPSPASCRAAIFLSTQRKPKKKDKKTFVPSGNKSSSLPFGYSPEQIKNFKYEDFDRAKKSGNNEEAKFIQEQMVNNYENS